MKNQFKRVLGIGLAFAMLLTCTITGWVLPTAALTPEYGDVELVPEPLRPNLLNGQGPDATTKIWKPVADISDASAATVTIPAEVGGKYWNLYFLELNTTYTLSGRVKGGAMSFYFYNQIVSVNGINGGSKTPKANEDDWTEFSYTFTTGTNRPSREYDWIWFGNGSGTTTCYMDSLSITKTDIADLAVTDFTWDSPSHTLNPGDVVNGFSVTVTNNGADIPEDARFAVEIRADATTEIATIVHKGGLKAGESVTYTSNRRWTATAGDHALTAYVRNGRYLYEPTKTMEDNQSFYNVYVSQDDLAVPDVAAAHGMTALTFSDHFDNVNTIDNNATGATGYKWYVTRPYGEAKQVLDSDYSVENGVLRLHSDQTRWAYSIATIDIVKPVGFAFNKGYLEYRIRVPETGDEGWDTGWSEDKDNGAVRNPGVWAYPTTTLWASAKNERNADSVEMDWMEYHGDKYTATFATTLHERHSEWVYNESTGQNEWTKTWHTTVSDEYYDKIGSATEFHTLSCLWEDGYVTTYLDGVRIGTIAYSATDYPTDRISEYTNQPAIGSMTGMDSQFLPIILGGSEEFQMEVDYVRVWQIPEDAVKEEVEFKAPSGHVTIPLGYQDTMTVVDNSGNAVHGLYWQSSDTSVVSAYSGGTIRANKPGTATIIVSDDFGNAATFTVTVDRYANSVQNSDFEGLPAQKNWYHVLWGGNASTSSETYPQAELYTESDGNTCIKILANSTVQTRYYKGAQLKANRTYQVTFRYKGSFTFRIYDQNSYITSGDGKFNLSGSSNSWKNASYTFSVGDNIPNNGNLTALTIGFLNIANTAGYVDDFSIREVAPANTITVNQTTGGTVSVSKTTGLTVGEAVTVTVTPNSGYILKAGTLTYTTQEGYVRKILNNSQSTDNVYGGAGNVFTMNVPVGATTVTAEFESTATNNYQFGTIATAVRRVNGKVDAVRFLNRLYIDGLDLTADSLTVRHNGQVRTVTQIGVLMTRGHQRTLTMDDYTAYKSGQSSAKVWHALSYKNTSSTLFVLEYTDRYMDFVINMSTTTPHNPSFLLRDYTICGYMMLDNGEIIYTEAMWDNAADAMAREAELK